jgi:hypothetical protein
MKLTRNILNRYKTCKKIQKGVTWIYMYVCIHMYMYIYVCKGLGYVKVPLCIYVHKSLLPCLALCFKIIWRETCDSFGVQIAVFFKR